MFMLRIDVYEEHLSEAAFLQSQWERALRGPRFNLEATAQLEERLLAHLDGLVVGGDPVAETLLRPALEGGEPGEVFCSAFASIAESPPAALEAVFALAPVAPPAVQASLRRALELSGRSGLETTLVSLLRVPDASLQALALEVLAFRGALPRGAALELLDHVDGRVVVAALRGLGAWGRDIGLRDRTRLLGDNRSQVRLAAIESGLLSGVRAAWDACQQEAQGHGEGAYAARMLQAICGDDQDVERMVECLTDESARENVLWALGFTGRIAAAEACLELMGQVPPVSRLAGEAFSAITGLVLKDTYAVEVEEEEFLPPLEEDDLDADLTPKQEDELPVPARAAVADWWQRARKDYSRSARYLGGKPFSGDALLDVLARGPMRRRHVHAQELALRTQGAHNVQTLAFTARQRAELARFERVCANVPARPLARTFGG
ncbi:TIGR02270 family protein [Myxococcus sp. Y35]|uniref:TIGR02270 family protein n=1 Tax=Pseudomyxococcus flavus TaxID=3115648 RepID=UPI003CF96D94